LGLHGSSDYHGGHVLACVDVDYRAGDAVAACLVFADVSDAAPLVREVARIPIAAEYQPGELYRRELPALLAVLARVTAPLSTVFVDGHVWLGTGRPGLGAHLHDALDGRVAVIGVAKRPFLGAPSIAVVRGKSRVPLHVTAQGIAPEDAARLVADMHGPHRLPTMLKAVDSLARRA
jgi:deoxyribonuclease V